jgi:DNA-binding CsgD family transcriptional regulator
MMRTGLSGLSSGCHEALEPARFQSISTDQAATQRPPRALPAELDAQARINPCCQDIQHLTQREIDILLCIAEGLTSGQTGTRLSISRRTVEYHMAEMLRRTASRSSTELVARCYVAGILMSAEWPPKWSGQLCLKTNGPATSTQETQACARAR